MNEVPARLYHGTSSLHLLDILKRGILPRGRTGKNNWKHSVGSNAKAVYLTDTYGLYFAMNSTSTDSVPRDECVVLEVDASRLDLSQLHADEDVLEQANRGQDQLPAGWDMKRRTIWYRTRAHQFSGTASLAAMGTCTYHGTIDPGLILRVAVLSQDTTYRMICGGMDPMISITNYKFMRDKYVDFNRWLFGDLETWSSNPELSRDGVVVSSPLGTAINALVAVPGLSELPSLEETL